MSVEHPTLAFATSIRPPAFTLPDVCGSGDLYDLNVTLPAGCGGLADVYGQDRSEPRARGCSAPKDPVVTRTMGEKGVLQPCRSQSGGAWAPNPTTRTKTLVLFRVRILRATRKPHREVLLRGLGQRQLPSSSETTMRHPALANRPWLQRKKGWAQTLQTALLGPSKPGIGSTMFDPSPLQIRVRPLHMRLQGPGFPGRDPPP